MKPDGPSQRAVAWLSAFELKSRVTVERRTFTSVVLTDGAELPADLVVYATGYGSMNGWAAQLIARTSRIGSASAGASALPRPRTPALGKASCATCGSTHQEALWFHGGNLQQSRFYSLILALQIKAREAGMETPVYGLQEVHHLS